MDKTNEDLTELVEIIYGVRNPVTGQLLPEWPFPATVTELAGAILDSDWLKRACAEAAAETKASVWDEAVAAIFEWWSSPVDQRAAFIVNPYGVGLSEEKFMEGDSSDE